MKLRATILALLIIVSTQGASAENIFCGNAKLVVNSAGLDLRSGNFKKQLVDGSKKRIRIDYGIYSHGSLIEPSVLAKSQSESNVWLNRCGVIATQDMGLTLPAGEYAILSDVKSCYFSYDTAVLPHTWKAEIRGLKKAGSAFIACFSTDTTLDLSWINETLAGKATIQELSK